VDFRKIEYFIQVAECLSFAKASEKICISHQALSKQIRLLEEEIGAPLFERTTAKVNLTEVGKKMYSAFAPAVSELYKTYDEITNYVKLRKSKLFLGYFNALSHYQVVEPVVEYLKEKKYGLGIDQFAFDIGEARERLMDDRLDLLITVMINPDEWKMVQYYSIYRFPMKIIVSQKHPWFSKTSITRQDLAQADMLYYQAGSSVFMENIKVRQRINMHNYDSYMAQLSEGKAFGIIADIYSRREGSFKLLELPKEDASFGDIIVAFKKEHPLKDTLGQLQKFSLS
jgi:DNA-binding transcriptional LysR family regulator